MKNVLLIALLLLTVSCKEELCDCYHGYVFDENKKPIDNVKVYEEAVLSNSTYTNKEGYFKLDRDSFIANLIFKKEGFEIDRISTYIEFRGGDKTIFITKKSDTLFMKRKE